jgi:putative zinc binding protein
MLEAIGACRSCGGRELHPVLSLGHLPLADWFPGPGDLDRPDPTYPLNMVFCAACALVQIRETVSPEVLFDENYRYYSSFSDALVSHARTNARALIRSRGLGPGSFVLELASNDGYMLRHFVDQGIQVLGFEPAEGPA